jgi:hypothetical protein
MPFIDLSILNQRQTPAFYADVFANRPAAGFVGRIFISTNTFAFYRDNGTSWDLIGGPGTGTVTGTGANGQVTFWNGASTITGSNDLFWDATNGHLGVNTNAPGTALDVHHDQPTVAILNQTVATNDVRIGFQNNGVGLWRIGAFYNAGANDFGIYDAVAAIQPVTVKKTTGQVLIGTSTVGSGKLVVASASSDNGIQIVGATAPSLRIDSAESGPTKRAGLGISTATNNFIQGSADRDFCIFNGSTAAASPILFGVYNTGAANVQEAARISSAYNLIVGSIVDNGRKLQINGDASFATNGLFGGSNNPGNAGSYTVSVGVPGTTAGGIQLWAATNQSSFLQFGDGTASADNYRGYVSYNHNTDSLILGTASEDRLTIASTGSATFRTPGNTTGLTIRHFAGTNNPGLFITTTESNKYVTLTASGSSVAGQLLQLGAEGNSGTLNISASNVLIGTTTDGGQKLQVNGNAIIGTSATSQYRFNIGANAPAFEVQGGAGSGSVAGSANIRIGDVTNSRYWIQQINNSYNYAYWFFDGGTWTNVSYLDKTTGAYVALSDKNKKKNFENSNLGLNAVLKLKPTLYNMLTEKDEENKQLGFIAQEVKDIIPQAYQESGDFIGLNYQPIVATIVKAIQELNTKIENLK